jgi:hypothetical protein
MVIGNTTAVSTTQITYVARNNRNYLCDSINVTIFHGQSG